MIGEILSHYRILQKIGEGAMGEVYRALDTRLQREVALKILPPELAGDPRRLARFEREAKIVASLNDPHIVTLHSVERDRGLHFFTLELIDGETLDRRIPDGGFDLSSFLRHAVPIARALAAAHRRGVTHRDLKPTNVMVDFEAGRVKVLDFGVAKEIAEETTEGVPPTIDETALMLTEAGGVIGTVPYMAPEQLRGDRATVSSDLFSMGVVFYEMLTGLRPFKGRSQAELISAILRDEPTNLLELEPHLPRRLVRLVHRLLEKEIARRPDSAADVVEQLEQIRLEHESGTYSGSLAAAILPVRPSTRRRLVRWASVFGALLAIAVLALFVRLAVRPEPLRQAGPVRLAVLPFENLSEPEFEFIVQGLREEVYNRFVSVPGLRVIANLSVAQLVDEGLTAKEIASRLDTSHLLGAGVRWSAEREEVTFLAELVDADDEATVWSGSYVGSLEERDEVMAQIAEDIARELRVLGNDLQGIQQSTSRDHQANVAFLRGQAAQANSSPEEAVSFFRRAVERDPTFLTAWAHLAMALSSTYYNTSFALEDRLAAEEALRKAEVLAPDDPLVLMAKGILEVRFGGDARRAMTLITRARRIFPSNSELAMVQALAAQRLGRWSEAIDLLEEALSTNPGDARLANTLAMAQLFSRRCDDAVRSAEKALASNSRLARAVFVKWQGLLACGAPPREALLFVRSVAAANPVQQNVDVPDMLAVTTSWLAAETLVLSRDYEAAAREVSSYWGLVGGDLQSFHELWYSSFVVDDLDRPEEWYRIRAAFRARSEAQVTNRDASAKARVSVALLEALDGRLDAASDLLDESLGEELEPLDRAWVLERAARVRVRIDQREAALGYLEELAGMPYGTALTSELLRLDPSWDALRDAAGWAGVVNRMEPKLEERGR